MDEDPVNDATSADGTEPCFCTHAVTGDVPSIQAIYICHDCFEDEDGTARDTPGESVSVGGGDGDGDGGPAYPTKRNPLCICEGCAETCHVDHEVEYIGMGPSYCDCQRVCSICQIYDKSLMEGKRLGLVRQDNSPIYNNDESDQHNEDNMIMEIFDMPSLKTGIVAQFLVDQAQELIKWTKDTHWIDLNTIEEEQNELCAFEILAWNLYKAHCERLECLKPSGGTDDGKGGAEWWVQVKVSTITDNEDLSKEATSIGLHYDKDEALAESFGLGSFPAISTVTYLTAAVSDRSTSSSPTVVFDHRYTQGEEEVMSKMLFSQPRIGKHLIFDGRLLHGAPSARYFPPTDTSALDDDISHQAAAAVNFPSIRVTFLVNIWKNRRPANVQLLDPSIRMRLLQKDNACNLDTSALMDVSEMERLSIPTMQINTEDDLPEKSQLRIELPFVSKGTDIIWENELDKDFTQRMAEVKVGEDEDDADGEENDSGLVVVTFPPPPSCHDTILLSFGPGMQAYLDHPALGRDCDETQEPSSENDGTTKPERKSDYV